MGIRQTKRTRTVVKMKIKRNNSKPKTKVSTTNTKTKQLSGKKITMGTKGRKNVGTRKSRA